MTVISTKLQGWLHLNSLAKHTSLAKFLRMSSVDDKQCPGHGHQEEGSVISIRMDSVDRECKVHATSFIRKGSTH